MNEIYKWKNTLTKKSLKLLTKQTKSSIQLKMFSLIKIGMQKKRKRPNEKLNASSVLKSLSSFLLLVIIMTNIQMYVCIYSVYWGIKY